MAFLAAVGALALGWSSPSAAERGLLVVDAAGGLVGPVLSMDSDTGLVAVLLESDGTFGVAWVGREHFGRGNSQVVYEADDCTGPALLVELPSPAGVTFEPVFAPTGVVAGNLLLRSTGEPPVDTLVHSSWNENATCEVVEFQMNATPATPFLDLSRFPPPFTVR